MSSADAHAALAADDTALPGLATVLDDHALGERLGGSTARSYLRYKTGQSAIALVDVAGRAAIVAARPVGQEDKRGKALRHIEPADVLLDAPSEGLLVVDAMADRHLGALRHVVRTDRLAGWLTKRGLPVDADARAQTLAHKPARRWVGRVPLTGERAGGHVVLRAYARDGYQAALAAHGLLDPDACPSVALPRVLGTHRRGLIALTHLPGRTLDTCVGPAAMRRLGACLGELHASGPTDVEPVERPPASTGLDVLAPVLGPAVDEADAIAAEASAALRSSPGGVVHGDFSLDQVVADGHSLGIIDLDRTRLGNPLDDLASLLAAAALTALPSGGHQAAVTLMERLQAPFAAGHASTWTGPLGDDLGPRTALALLDRAGEPFRAGRPDWPEVTRELIALAGSLVEGRVVT